MGYIQFTFQEATFCFLLLGIGPDSSQKQNSGSIEEELELGLELEMEVRMSGIGSCSLVAEAVWKEIESTRTLTEHHLSTLHFIFGKNFEGASRIVDQRGVNRIEAHPSRRFIFQFRLGRNPEEKSSISAFLIISAPAILSSMTLLTEQNNSVVNIN